MVLAKKETKTPAVIVETKKISTKDTCGITCCNKIKHVLVPVLLVLNTLLIIRVLGRQVSVESDRVGGRDNYNMVQQIYKSDTFKAQQKQQIEQALQMYQQGTQGATATTPTDTQGVQTAEQVAPTTTVMPSVNK